MSLSCSPMVKPKILGSRETEQLLSALALHDAQPINADHIGDDRHAWLPLRTDIGKHVQGFLADVSASFIRNIGNNI